MKKTREKKNKIQGERVADKDNRNAKKKGFVALKKAFRFYKKYMKIFLLSVFLSLAGSVLNVIMPILNGNLIDQLTKFNVNRIFYYALWLLAVTIAVHIVYTFWNILILKINTNVKRDIKHQLISSLTEMEIQNFDKTNSGVFIARVNKDSSALATFYNGLFDCLIEILSNIGFVIYIGFLSFYMFLFIFAYILIILLIENHRIRIKFKNEKKLRVADEKVVGVYSEVIRGVRDIKVLNLKNNANKRTERIQDETIKISHKISITDTLWRKFGQIVKGILDFAFIVVCVLLVKNNLMALSVALIVFIYMGRVRGLVINLINMKQYLVEGELSAQRVFEILENSTFKKETFGNVELKDIKGEIKFDNVTFGYSENIILFKNLSFDINAGQTVAIVGKSGQGKSTILSLIDKLYKVNDGKITIDGINFTNFTEKILREKVTIIV